MSQEIDLNSLRSLLHEKPDLVLLDVRLADDYAAGHLPGAKNNCVYEVAFGGRMEDIAADKATPLCVYGANENSHESRMAAEKLDRAGYESVYDYRGGVDDWSREGAALEGSASPLDEPRIQEGRYPVDLEESRVGWTGRNLLNKHTGTLQLTSGHLDLVEGTVTGGEFIIDMNSLKCTDLAGSPLHDVLIDHLKSDDFFDVEHYPDIRFRIVSATPVDGRKTGAPNLKVEGELTMKGVTRPVSLMAATGITPEGRLAAQATLSIDRTQWNVIYGSSNFFKRLGGHLVNDELEIELRIVTTKEFELPG